MGCALPNAAHLLDVLVDDHEGRVPLLLGVLHDLAHERGLLLLLVRGEWENALELLHEGVRRFGGFRARRDEKAGGLASRQELGELVAPLVLDDLGVVLADEGLVARSLAVDGLGLGKRQALLLEELLSLLLLDLLRRPLPLLDLLHDLVSLVLVPHLVHIVKRGRPLGERHGCPVLLLLPFVPGGGGPLGI